MPWPKYCTDNILTHQAKAECRYLRDVLRHSSGYLSGDVFSEYNSRLNYLLQLLRYQRIDF